MAARSPQHPEAGWFTTPTQVNHRRYEALRAFFVDGLTYQQAADRFGYPRWAMVNLVREWRAGRLELFVPPRKPGPPAGVAPAKQRVRGRVIQPLGPGAKVQHGGPGQAGVAPASPRSWSRRGSAGCCAARPRPKAAPRPPLAATPACPGPPCWTLAPGPSGWTPPGPGCCWCSPTL